MASQLRKAIMEKCTFKSKENMIGEPANKTPYQRQRQKFAR